MAGLDNTCTLITSDRLGSDLILKEYPGRITQDQIEKVKIGRRVVYRFLGLQSSLLDDFLSKYPAFDHLRIEHTN
jgi:hypothetical protein